MFLHLSVILFTGEWGFCPGEGGLCPGEGDLQPREGGLCPGEGVSLDGLCPGGSVRETPHCHTVTSRWYPSYWNVFLLRENSNAIIVSKHVKCSYSKWDLLYNFITTHNEVGAR